MSSLHPPATSSLHPPVELYPRPPSTCTMLDAPHRARLVRSSRKLSSLLGTTPSVLGVLKPMPPLAAVSTNAPATALAQRTPPRKRASPKKTAGSPALRRKRIEKLKRQLGENVPPELLFAAAAAPRSKHESVFSPPIVSILSPVAPIHMDTDTSVASVEAARTRVVFQTPVMDIFTSSPPPPRSTTRRGIRPPDFTPDTSNDVSLGSTLFTSLSSLAPKISTPARLPDDSFLDLEAALDLVSSAETSYERADTSFSTSFACTPPEHAAILDARELRRLTVHMPLGAPLSAEFGATVDACWADVGAHPEVQWMEEEEVEMCWPAPELSALKFTFPQPTSRSGLDLSRGYGARVWHAM